jgi:hypothetical protein
MWSPPISAAAPSYGLGVLGVGSYAGIGNDYGVNFTRQAGWGAGLFGDVNWQGRSPISIRTEFLFINRTFIEGYQQASGTVTSKVLDIPVIMLWRFAPWASLGLGLYYRHTLGQLEIEANGVRYVEDYSDNPTYPDPWQYKISEWGWIAELSGNYPLSPRWDIVGELRYQRQLRWNSFYPTSDFSITVGMRLNFTATPENGQDAP